MASGPSPSFTRLVSVSELLDNILNQFSDYDVDRKSRVTLSNLAITCQHFSEPALNVLWRHQTNLLPLFRLLPDDLWFVEREYVEWADNPPDEEDSWEEEETGPHDRFPEDDEDTIHVIKFRRNIEHQDTPRFDHFRDKIRQLQPFSLRGYVYVLHPDVSRAMCERYGSLLPNLQRVDLTFTSGYYERSVPFTSALLGPRVNSIMLSTIGYADDSGGFLGSFLLSEVEKHAPNAQSLAWLDIEVKPSALRSLVSSLRGLRVLGCQGVQLSPADVRMLGELPCLEALVKFRLDSTVERWESGTALNLFPRLQSLHGLLSQWSQLAWFFNPNQRHLKDIAILRATSFHPRGQTIPGRNARAFHEILAQIAAHPHLPHTLTSLSLQEFPDKEGEGAAVYWSQVDLSPLIQLSSLLSLNIHSPSVYFIDDTWLSRATSRWTKLQSLYLIPPRSLSNITPAMSLAGLVPVLENCRGLVNLHFTAIWEPFDPLPIMEKSAFNTSITLLPHSYSSLGLQQHGQVAHLYHCLMTLFPRLQELRSISPSGGSTLWKELGELVKAPPPPPQEGSDNDLRSLFMNMIRHREIV